MYYVDAKIRDSTHAAILNEYDVKRENTHTWLLKKRLIGWEYTLTATGRTGWILESKDEPNWKLSFLVTPTGVALCSVAINGRTYCHERYLKKYIKISFVAKVFIEEYT